MADKTQRSEKNVPGKYYVDKQCNGFALCMQFAPKHFAKDEATGKYYVCKQPETPDEVAQCEQAVISCPMMAIGNDG